MKLTMNGQDMFPARYASGSDLAGKPYTLIIDRVAVERMTNPRTHQESDKYVVYFTGAKRGFVLGKQFAESIATSLNETDAEKWKGKKVTLFPIETRLGVGVRARPPVNGTSTLPDLLAHGDPDEDDETAAGGGR
jgi:hypothetical protein